MAKRALLKFRNPDSTADINDRQRDLFNKGVFSGGEILTVSGVYRINLEPFATVGSDGMFVRESLRTTLDVVPDVKNYIVIRQQYISNGEPVLSVESMTEGEFSNDPIGSPPEERGHGNPFLIVFGTVTPSSTSMPQQVFPTDISLVERNVVDPLGRLEFRGSVVDELDLPKAGDGVNRENDFYIVRNGPGTPPEPSLFAWNGVTWFNMTNAGEVLLLLEDHQANLLEDQKHLTDIQAAAMESTTGTGSEAVDTAVLPNEIPLTEFALNYDGQTSRFAFGEVVTGQISGAFGTVAFDSTKESEAIGSGTLALKNVTNEFQDDEPISGDGSVPDPAGPRAIVNGTLYSNRVVAQQDPKIPTQNENDALAGNFTGAEDDLEPEAPSDTNRFVTSSKVMAVPVEKIFNTTPTYIELAEADGSIFVGRPDDIQAQEGTAQQWMNLYALNEEEDAEYLNSDFQTVKITRVLTGLPGMGPDSPANEVDPQTDANVDALGFYNPSVQVSLYLETDNVVDTGLRVSYGKKTELGELLPQLLMDRGPKGGQIDTRLLQLLLGTPNAQFSSAIFDASTEAGDVVAWNVSTERFVKADPENSLTPIGVRGNSNNLIQEGLYVAPSTGVFAITELYADKANPGQLTSTPNEWFIGRAISSSQLLVNMNAIALTSSGVSVPPVSFPENFFNNSLQPGQTVAWVAGPDEFQAADPDDPLRIPLGVRGNDNNVIQNGKYTSLSGSPFVGGTRYYFGRSALAESGTITPTPNDWPIGVGIDGQTLLVNATNVAIPRQWTIEHDSETGRHKFPTGGIGARPVDPVIGTIVLRNDDPAERNYIEYWDGSAWVTLSEETFDSGTRMLFVQDTIPTGWTIDLTLNDATVLITSTLSLGGLTSGSWVISGLVGEGHQLQADELPVHRHRFVFRSSDGAGDGFPGSADDGDAQSVNPTGTYGVHENWGDDNTAQTLEEEHAHGVTQDGSWRPFNVAVIVCEKD